MGKMKGPSGSRGHVFKALVITVVLVVVAGVVLAWLAFFTGSFAIKTVVIRGNKHLKVEQIRERSGVDSYTRLITLPVGRLDENLENDPWVKEAKVGRHLPDTVNIDVIERKPVAVVDFGGVGFLVDDEAHVMAQVTVDEFPELIRVHAGDASVPTVDSRVDNKKIRECIQVVGDMPAELRATLALLNPYDGRGYVFISRDGYNIIYGAVSESSRKDEILEAIIMEIRSNNRRVEYIDVTVPDSPVIRPI